MKKILGFALLFVLSVSLVACNNETETNLRVVDFSTTERQLEQGEKIIVRIEFNDLSEINVNEVVINRSGEHKLTPSEFRIENNFLIIDDYFVMGTSSAIISLVSISYNQSGNNKTLLGNENVDRFTVSQPNQNDTNLGGLFEDVELKVERITTGEIEQGQIYQVELTLNNLPEGYNVDKIVINGSTFAWGNNGNKTELNFLAPNQSVHQLIISEITLTNVETLEEEKLDFGNSLLLSTDIKLHEIDLFGAFVSSASQQYDAFRLQSDNEYAMEVGGNLRMVVRMQNFGNHDVERIFVRDGNGNLLSTTNFTISPTKDRITFDLSFAETGVFEIAFSHISYKLGDESFETEPLANPTKFSMTVVDKVIETEEEFLSISDNPSGIYLLKNDLDFSNKNYSASILSFSGILIGNGKTISNDSEGLYNTDPLFHHIEESAIIQNLTYNFGNFFYDGNDKISVFAGVNDGHINAVTILGFEFLNLDRNETPTALFVYENNGLIENINIDPHGQLTIDTMRKSTSILAVENNGTIQKVAINFNNFYYGDVPSSNSMPALNYTVETNNGILRDVWLRRVSNHTNVINRTIWVVEGEIRNTIHFVEPQVNTGSFENIVFDQTALDELIVSFRTISASPDEVYNLFIGDGRMETLYPDLYNQLENHSELFQSFIRETETTSWIDEMNSYITGETSNEFISILDILFARQGTRPFERNVFNNEIENFYASLNFSNRYWNVYNQIPTLR